MGLSFLIGMLFVLGKLIIMLILVCELKGMLIFVFFVIEKKLGKR